jgi:predicted deacylase
MNAAGARLWFDRIIRLRYISASGTNSVKKTFLRDRFLAAVPVLFALGVLAGAQVRIPARAPAVHDVRPGPGVKVKALSDYLPSLAKTPGDTAVYILQGAERGGTVFVAGGTHGAEIAGQMAAVLLIERARVSRGKLVVVPYANNSADTHPDPDRPSAASSFVIKVGDGERTFTIGSRLTKPEDQGEPDPPAQKNGAETDFSPRNLDRQYPGKADGNLTQRVAYAIVAVLRTEAADLAFDLHEAPPGSRLAMMIVANPKNIELAAEAALILESDGLNMKIEESSADFRGLSHREWGDATSASAFLFETPNPAMDRTAPGDAVNDSVWPLTKRVGIHLDALRTIVDIYNETAPAARRVDLLEIPGRAEIAKAGLGAFLRSAK